MKFVTIALALVWGVNSLNAQPSDVPKDTTAFVSALIGEWHFVQVIGPDGRPTDHINRGEGPNGETIRVQANGPDISIRADHSYEKRFTPKNKDVGYWSLKGSNEVQYSMLVPMNSKEGEMLRLAGQMFNKTLPIDGKGNYLDASTDHLILLSSTEMRVLEEGYIFVYRKQ